jgi:hypothetical protein
MRKPYVYGYTMTPNWCKGLAIPTHYIDDHYGGFHGSFSWLGDCKRLMVGATLWNAGWQWNVSLELLIVQIRFGWSERL